jgi:hypothetical protein
MHSWRIEQLEQRATLRATGRVEEGGRRRAEGLAATMGVSMVYDLF